MIVTVDEMKNYLRIDFEDDDSLLENFITAGVKQCMDTLRTDDENDLADCPNGKIAVMITVAYLYEHREEADHHAMDLTLRALLFGSRSVEDGTDDKDRAAGGYRDEGYGRIREACGG